MYTHTNRALCRWEAVWTSLNFNLCGAACDTYKNTAHLQRLCFLYSTPRRPSVKKRPPTPLQLETLIGTSPYSSRKLLNLHPVYLSTLWPNVNFPPALLLLVYFQLAHMSVSINVCFPVVEQHWPAKSALPSPMINMQAYGGATETRGRSRLEICLWFN